MSFPQGETQRVLRRIKDRAQNVFGVNVAEVESQDLWQRAGLGFAIVGNDARTIESMMEKLKHFIEELGGSSIIDSFTEIIHV
jgi:hypothetical protein